MRKLLIVLLLFTGCEQAEKETATFSGTAMTMEFKVIIGKKLSEKEIKAAETIILNTFDEVNRIYDIWNPESELSRLNALPPHTRAPLSKELEHLFVLTDEVVQLSNQRFDPTIAPLQKLWKEHLVQGNIPTSDAIENAHSLCGWNSIHFGNGFFYKDKACRLDLGGIAKGYCVDLLIERLREHTSVFVEWGGEIRAIGKHPAKRPWTIFISKLGSSDVDKAVDVIPISDQAIATSGDYLQHWTVNKTRYCHIIDPKKAMPLIAHEDSIASTSVCAPNCALADGLATAAMTFSSAEEANQWFSEVKKRYPDVQLWVQTISQETSSH